MATVDSKPQDDGPAPEDADEQEQIKPFVTRRDFLVGAGAGAAVGAAVVGGGITLTRPSAPPVRRGRRLVSDREPARS